MEGNDSFCALFLARIVVGHPFRNSASHVLWSSFVRAQTVADSCVADQTGCQRVLNDPDNGPCCPNNDLTERPPQCKSHAEKNPPRASDEDVPVLLYL